MFGKIGTAARLYRDHGAVAVKHRLEEKIVHPLANWYYRTKLGPGTDVMDQDWDNLIILDGCRYDAFQDRNRLSGTLGSRVSRGSSSKEFLDRNFADRDLQDTVYVSANPFVPRVGPDVFHAVLTVLDEWDEELQTIMPAAVVERALDAYATYPDKRIIVHFMQPHQPYIGEKGSEIRRKMRGEVDVIGWKGEPQEGTKQIRAPNIDGIDVSRRDVRDAYEENLDIVLDHTRTLLEKIDGKTAITSDHGELLGERILPGTKRHYGHPSDLWLPELRVVPWLVTESGERRNVVAEGGGEFESVDQDALDEKLRALGYQS